MTASGFGAMAAGLAVFALLASKLASTPGTLAPVPVTAAAIASLTRLIRFDPVFRDRDVATTLPTTSPGDILELMDLRSAATRPGKRTLAIRVHDTRCVAWRGTPRVRYA